MCCRLSECPYTYAGPDTCRRMHAIAQEFIGSPTEFRRQCLLAASKVSAGIARRVFDIYESLPLRLALGNIKDILSFGSYLGFFCIRCQLSELAAK